MNAETRYQAWISQINSILRQHNLVADMDAADLPLRTWCASGISILQAANRIMNHARRARKARRGRK